MKYREARGDLGRSRLQRAEREPAEGAPDGGEAAAEARPRFLNGYGLVLILIIAASFASAVGGDESNLATITTTGHGDSKARGDVGRLMAEAVAGHLYLITVVAIAVQNVGHRRGAGREAD